ncbi:MAG: helix-turn-helix transcriptional regulator [Limnobacter sp.]|uniref:helix-turn-helix domain-containing protein n=1 Tax=Limnobacter sp. TaxID=2003368 RepID=UPI002732B0B2|nr:helix-turn-helix transcriptional regulator [Limnobacter sp.]MDP3189168.1 helix-turn-helix transcriptional regulator [Limnobacter sp.]
MPAKFNLKTETPREQLLALGKQLKQYRKANKLSADAVATAAGLSRTTLHRIEAGEPSVAAGAYWAAVAALGLRCGIAETPATGPEALPDQIDLNHYPQLKLLAWHVQGTQFVSPRQAWDIYMRNWRHIEEAKIHGAEKKFIEQLRAEFEEPGRDV